MFLLVNPIGAVNSSPETRGKCRKPLSRFSGALISALLLCSTAYATETTLTFEDMAGIGTLGGFIPVQNRVSNNYQATTGAIFSTIGGASFVGVMNFGGANPISPPNTIRAASAHGDADNFLPILINFSLTGTNLGKVVNSVSVQGFDVLGRTNNTVFLVAYDSSGTQIDSDSRTTIGATLLSVSATDIASVRLYSSLGIVAWDNVTVSVVPEPPVYMLALAGIAGLVIRSRKSRTEA